MPVVFLQRVRRSEAERGHRGGHGAREQLARGLRTLYVLENRVGACGPRGCSESWVPAPVVRSKLEDEDTWVLILVLGYIIDLTKKQNRSLLC